MEFHSRASLLWAVFVLIFLGFFSTSTAELTESIPSFIYKSSLLYQSGRLIFFLTKIRWRHFFTFSKLGQLTPGTASISMDRNWKLLVALIGMASTSQHIMTFFLDRCCGRVEIQDFTSPYRIVLDWVSEHCLLEDFPSLTLAECRGSKFAEQSGSGKVERKLRYEPGFNVFLCISYRGHWLWLRRVRHLGRDGWTIKTIHIYCVSRNTNVIRQFLSDCKEQYEEKRNSRLRICRPEPSNVRHAGYGLWLEPELHPKVNMDDVVLDPLMRKAIMSTIIRRLRERRRDNRTTGAQLWSGPPGNGKSTFVEAIASEYNLTICRISLSDPTLTEEDLIRLVEGLEESLLLIEDIDSRYLTADKSVMQIRTTGHTETGGITGPCLLEVFDRIAKLKNVITIITSNFEGKRRGPLLRAGRIDNIVFFDNPDQTLIARFFRKFYSARGGTTEELADKFASALPTGALSFAEIQQYILGREEDANAAVRDVKVLSDSIKASGDTPIARGVLAASWEVVASWFACVWNLRVPSVVQIADLANT